MVVDVYKFFRDHPKFNKLVGDDFVFVEYKCPINVEEFQLWTKSHFISYTISGKKDWITPDKTYSVQAGDAVFIKKGVYVTKQYLEMDFCVMLMFINDEFIKQFLLDNEVENGMSSTESESEDQIYRIDMNESLQLLFTTMFNYMKNGNDIPENLVKLKFRELLFNILIHPGNKDLTNFLHSVKQSSKTSLDYVMNTNFRFDLSLDEFAELSGRSLSSFKRDFQLHFSETPGRWLTNKRLEYAGSLLLNSDLDVNEVCYDSGFKNPSHFNKAFKQKYNLPPQKYRAENQVDAS